MSVSALSPSLFAVKERKEAAVEWSLGEESREIKRYIVPPHVLPGRFIRKDPNQRIRMSGIHRNRSHTVES